MKTAVAIILFVASAFAQDSSAAAALVACGPNQTQFQATKNVGDNQLSLHQPDPGKALVYVIEDQKLKVVKDVTARLGVDGAWVGANRGNSYLVFSVEPGEHHLCTDWTSSRLPQSSPRCF